MIWLGVGCFAAGVYTAGLSKDYGNRPWVVAGLTFALLGVVFMIIGGGPRT